MGTTVGRLLNRTTLERIVRDTLNAAELTPVEHEAVNNAFECSDLDGAKVIRSDVAADAFSRLASDFEKVARALS